MCRLAGITCAVCALCAGALVNCNWCAQVQKEPQPEELEIIKVQEEQINKSEAAVRQAGGYKAEVFQLK